MCKSGTTRPVQNNLFIVKDPYSALTHFFGMLGSAILSPLMMLHAIKSSIDIVGLVSIAVFLLSMVLLYSASTIYHTFFINDNVSRILRKIDHCMIFVLIAGTYTPMCLIAIRDFGGPLLLLLVWFLAVIGIIFKICWVTCPKWVSSIIYICLGWSCLSVFPAVYRELKITAFILLFVGGLIYTAGGVIYALRLKAFNSRNPVFGSHEIFHLFVMAGNLAQFMCIWMCLQK